MTKTNRSVRAKLKKVRGDKHASRLLRVLRATGLFRWERPSTHSEEVLNILKYLHRLVYLLLLKDLHSNFFQFFHFL